jgi:hypothetical protein
VKTLFAVLTSIGGMLAVLTSWARKARATITPPPYRDVKIHLNLHDQRQGMAHPNHSFRLERPPDEYFDESPFYRDGEKKPWFCWLHFDKEPPTAHDYVSTRI